MHTCPAHQIAQNAEATTQLQTLISFVELMMCLQGDFAVSGSWLVLKLKAQTRSCPKVLMPCKHVDDKHC